MVISIISLACMIVLVIIALSLWSKNESVVQAVDVLSAKLDANLETNTVKVDTIDLNFIAELVRREGYVPNIDNENNSVFFKVYGDYVCAAYDSDNRFVISKKYVLDPETDMHLMSRAARIAESEIFLLKIYTHTDETGQKGIVFEAPLLISSAEDLARFFVPCLQIVYQGIEIHRKHLEELSNESVPDQEPENPEKVRKILS